jgi:phospholipase/carboxylesterase
VLRPWANGAPILEPVRGRGQRAESGGTPRRAAEGRLDSRPGPVPDGPALPPGVHALDLDGGAQTLLSVPPGDPRPRPLLVFFHGAGGDAAQGLRLVGDAAAGAGVVLLATTSGARTWDLLAGGLGRDVAVLDAALAAAFARTPVDRVALAGFSDGGSYALSLGLANGELAEAVLAFSPGFVAAPARVGSPRVRIVHGAADRVLPVERCGRRVARELAGDGYDVTYEEFGGGHVVPPDEVTAALAWWLTPSG